MASVSSLQATHSSGFSTDNVKWNHLLGGDGFNYPINYWIAILGAQPDTGRIDFLGKWEPNSYCHYHRHLGETTTIVLEGEHHLVEKTATQTIHKTRTRGHIGQSPYGETHMEYARENASVLLFSMQCRDKYDIEVLDQDDKAIKALTFEEFVSGNY